MNILETPNQYKDFSIPNYPQLNNKKNFEGFFYDFFTENNVECEFTYIPIQWTNYLVSNGYGKNIEDLQNFLSKNLESDKKYFTVVQYAGGPLIKLDNTLIFSMGGAFNTPKGKNSKIIPLPLLYNHNFLEDEEEKKYIASYLGRNTHKTRSKLQEKLSNKEDFYINNLSSMSSEIGEDNIKLFENLMKRSHFSLCPRGYGPTSFRLYESIKMGVVPVYISDNFFLPFQDVIDWKKFSILLKDKHIKKLPKILQRTLEDGTYAQLKESVDIVNKKFFTFDYMASYIRDKI